MASKGANQNSAASAKTLSPAMLIFFGLIFLLVVILLVTGGSNLIGIIRDQGSVSPTPKLVAESTLISSDKDINEEWKVYSNKEYGYKIKYPKGWYVKTYSNLPNRTLFNKNPLPSAQPAESEPVLSEIEILVTEEKNTTEEIDKLKLAHQFENFSETKVEVGGVAGTRIEGKATGESYITGNLFVRVFVNKNSRTYSLTFTSTDKKNLEIFNQMISALEFI